MKRILILIILLLSCAANLCNAQSDTSKCKILSYGIRAGFNASTRIGTDGLSQNLYHWRHSFNVGATLDVRKSKRFLGRTGIYYTEKGYNEYPNKYTQLNYLEMPLLAVFQFTIWKKIKFEMQSGMFFAYGVGGRWNTTVPYPLFDEESDYINFDNHRWVELPSFKATDWSPAAYKRSDIGVNFGLGINVSYYYIGASYDISLGHEHRNSNYCYMIDLGYTFRLCNVKILHP